MVHWNELCSILATNSFQTYTMKPLSCFVSAKPVDSFPIDDPQTPPYPNGSTPETSGSDMLPEHMDLDELSNVLILPPAPSVPATTNTKMPVLPAVPLAALDHVVKKNSAQLVWSKHTLDPIVLGLDAADILYNDVPKTIKKQKEIEEALRIEERIGMIYKSQGGRSRGWTKALLETIIKPRCASGGDLYELKSSKSVFLWQMAGTDKPTSAVLDFLCVAKQIRVAIWDEESRHILIFPAADYIGEDAATKIPLYNISNTGQVLKSGFNTGSALVKFAKEDGWTLLPPQSVIHSLEKLTLAELASIGEKLGMGAVVGTKIERIAAIASFKLKSRLSA